MDKDRFNPTPNPSKKKVSVSIDRTLHEMIEKIKIKYGVSYSRALNEILVYFNDNVWEGF